MNSPKPILQLMDDFLANHDVHESTRKRYRENLQMFIGWLTRNCTDIKNPLRADILRYKQYLIDSKLATTTIDAYLGPVRLFFTYLEEAKIYDNVSAGVHSPRRYLGYRKDYLRSEQVNALLISIDRSTITGKRDYAIISLMCNTGMRCVEVSRLDYLDIQKAKAGYSIAIQGKGHINKDRSIAVPDVLIAPIREYIHNRTMYLSNPPLFVNHSYVANNTRFTQLSISKIIKKYMRAIDIDSSKLTAHSLRHTAAINAIKAGAKISDVQSMLGHRHSYTTDIYLRALEAESAEEGTAIRLLHDYYKSNKINDKRRQKVTTKSQPCNL
jgi:integrase/recombinase XerC/integrase/recombinase XerD